MGKRYATKRRLGAAKRRGTKRRGTKRRGTKRRGTKRRGTKRRATRARKSFRRKIIRGGTNEITNPNVLNSNYNYDLVSKIMMVDTPKNDDDREDLLEKYTRWISNPSLKYVIVAHGCKSDDSCGESDDPMELIKYGDVTHLNKVFEKAKNNNFVYTSFKPYRVVESAHYPEAKSCFHKDSDCEKNSLKVYPEEGATDLLNYRQDFINKN